MSLILDVDGSAWRERLHRYAATTPGLVPVIKGNGYGLGRQRLAEAASALQLDMVAVSDPEEVASVRDGFVGEILVMSPWLAGENSGPADAATLRTIGHPEALARPDRPARFVVEGVTSMRRHGLTPAQFDAATAALRLSPPVGLALHLPLDRPQGSDPVGEVVTWIERYRAADLPLKTMWVSHLSPAELQILRNRFPDVTMRPRIGTDLWLGRRDLLRPRATVLDVRPLRPGDRYGYRQQRAARSSVLVIISGGTAHGIGLEAPVVTRGLVRRGKRLATGLLGSVGRTLSPFVIAGRRRWFAEPPHMQVSMVLLPADATPPAVGDEVGLDVRMTATTFDTVRGLTT